MEENIVKFVSNDEDEMSSNVEQNRVKRVTESLLKRIKEREKKKENTNLMKLIGR